MSNENQQLLKRLQYSKPSAFAEIKGGANYPQICGNVLFYDFDDVCVVSVTFHALPATQTNIFGLHIHQNGVCDGNFSSAGEHFGDGQHPNHKGDLPPIFSCHGNSFMIVSTDRFSVKEIIGKTVILHLSPDDFKTQPSGDSGERIACGIIKLFNQRKDKN